MYSVLGNSIRNRNYEAALWPEADAGILIINEFSLEV